MLLWYLWVMLFVYYVIVMNEEILTLFLFTLILIQSYTFIHESQQGGVTSSKK